MCILLHYLLATLFIFLTYDLKFNRYSIYVYIMNVGNKNPEDINLLSKYPLLSIYYYIQTIMDI